MLQILLHKVSLQTPHPLLVVIDFTVLNLVLSIFISSVHQFYITGEMSVQGSVFTICLCLFSFQFFSQCLIRVTAGGSRRQVGIFRQSSFSADKYLSWLRKTYSHISLWNQLFPYCFSFFNPSHRGDKGHCCHHCCSSYWLGLKDPQRQRHHLSAHHHLYHY